MDKDRMYTISEAARLLEKPQNRKLIKRLIRFKKIETQVIGNSLCINQSGFDVLSNAVKDWDARPRVNDHASA